MSNSRQALLSQWCAEKMSVTDIVLDIVSGDASFRRYYRFSHNGTSYIAVDAPPEKENSQPFVAIAKLWLAQGINVPHIIGVDLSQGYMLLTDFGDSLLLDELELSEAKADVYYPKALAELKLIAALSTAQSPELITEIINKPSTYSYHSYDAVLLRQEMQLFDDWFYHKHLGFTAQIPAFVETLMQTLVQNALDQPQVVVHRDFHSRNIMLTDDNALGIIDFQDAVIGAITYDAASLLKDCYISWPRAKVLELLKSFQQMLAIDVSFETFTQWFDLMGLQRHIKVAGIFCRLSYRDGKSAYLNDLPLVLAYIIDVCQRYSEQLPEITAFSAWLSNHIMPAYYAQSESLESQVKTLLRGIA